MRSQGSREDEYFEIVPDHYWTENAFGEGEELIVGFSLFLKGAYASRLSQTGNSTIACTVSFDAREKTLEVNWKEKSFTEVPYNTENFASSVTTGLDDARVPLKPFEEGCHITSALNDYNMVPLNKEGKSNLFWVKKRMGAHTGIRNFYYGENFEMVRITGTLELIVE